MKKLVLLLTLFAVNAFGQTLFPDGVTSTDNPNTLGDLTVSGAFTAPPMVRVAYKISGANPGSYTAPNNFDLDTEDETIFSTVGTWSNDGAGVITIPESGVYHIEGLFGVSTGGWDTNTFFGINKNGTTIRDIVDVPTAGDLFRVPWSIELELALNDTISVEADKGSGLPVITGAIRNATRISIRKVSE